MPIDLKRLLKKCLKRIAGGLNFTPTGAKTTLAGDLGSPAGDDKHKELNGTPDDASLQHPQWDRFFSNLLNPPAAPGLDCSARAGSNGQDMTADDEAVAHLFTGSVAIQTLKAHLDQVPEIRQQQVDSLKQAIAEARYQMHPQQIAAAMLADGGLNLC